MSVVWKHLFYMNKQREKDSAGSIVAGEEFKLLFKGQKDSHFGKV